MKQKLAVPPIPPSQAVATVESAIPTTWEEAFNYLGDRFARIFGRQAVKIKDLTIALEDANAVIAAGDRARADLAARIDGFEKVLDSFSSKITAHESTVSERLTDVENAATATAQRVTAAEELVEAVSGRVEGLDTAVVADRTEAVATVARLDALDPQLVNIADVLDQTGAKLVHIGETLDATGARISAVEDTARERADVLDRKVALLDQTGAAAAASVLALGDRVGGLADGLGAAVSALEQETKARTAAVAAVARSVDELSETASEQDHELDQKIAALDQRTGAAANDVETILGRMEAFDGEIGDRFTSLGDKVEAVSGAVRAHAAAIDEDRARLAKVEDGVESFIRITAAAGAEIKTFDVRLTQLADEATDACRRVTIALGEMPAAMMINRQGHLVRVSRAGEEVDLGCVIADGKDAADIVSARIEKGRLVFTRSDRTEFGCEMPAAAAPAPAAPAVPEIDPTALGYLSKDANVRAIQVDDMRKMREDKKTYAKIGEKYGTSARHVVRLLKGE